jgi:hypothetical protein
VPRLNDPEIEPVYQAAEAFREAALRTDGSLFTPDRPIWSLPVLDDLHAKFVGRPEERWPPGERCAPYATLSLQSP